MYVVSLDALDAAALLADNADILSIYGADERTQELGWIAGYMHDIGNVINRVDHAQSGAMMTFRILDKIGMDPKETAMVITAIGNHDEGTGVPVNPIAAALILFFMNAFPSSHGNKMPIISALKTHSAAHFRTSGSIPILIRL